MGAAEEVKLKNEIQVFSMLSEENTREAFVSFLATNSLSAIRCAAGLNSGTTRQMPKLGDSSLGLAPNHL